MTDDIKAFVLMKYEIPNDSSEWESCAAKFPEEVKSKWAWRCVEAIEHFTEVEFESEVRWPEAIECIRISKLYRDGKATMGELDKAWNKVRDEYDNYLSCHTQYFVAQMAVDAALGEYYDVGDTGTSCYAISDEDIRTIKSDMEFDFELGVRQEEYWEVYIEWLTEELCEYEQSITV